MSRALENAGVLIVKTLASTEKVDAFSRRGLTPLVIVNTFKESPSHWVFDMAHELGHFVCHVERRTGSPETEHERMRLPAPSCCLNAHSPESSGLRRFHGSTCFS